MKRKLVVLHIDGVSADALRRALDGGEMPFLRSLIDAEGYELHRYRCGLPSTTPFSQAGILYGDNSEIPSFRWWDRERRVFVQFGARSTFKQVAASYFQGCEPLTKDGACIAACYPGGAADDFGIAYQDRSYGHQDRSRSAASVLVPYLANPIHLGDWLWQTVTVLGRTSKDYVEARAEGRHPARAYVITDVLEEIFVHHLTRYAVQKAMREGYSPIYAGFYAFDETAHAFGPTDNSSLRVLKHVDRSIRKIASTRDAGYEMVVLSDHGQVDTVTFAAANGRAFGGVLADLLPGFRVQEVKGKEYGASETGAIGRVHVTLSGGLAHVYFADRPVRMSYRELAATQPELGPAISELEQVALVMARDGEQDVFLRGGREIGGAEINGVLARYDDPEILLAQLSRLNSFRNAGDLLVFGAFIEGKQVNFENQAGGHGSIGGEQLVPFVLAKKDWNIDTSGVNGAHELHPILVRLRDELLEGSAGGRLPEVSPLHNDHRADDQHTAGDLGQ